MSISKAQALINEAKKNHLTSLNLSSLGLVSIPEEVFELPWLKKLILSNTDYHFETMEWAAPREGGGVANRINKIPVALRKLRHLEEFYFDNDSEKKSHLQGTEVLSTLKNLKVISLDYHKVDNIEPLKYLINLSTLSLNNTGIRNLEPLRNLFSLKHLLLGHNGIVNVEPLSNLSGLIILSLQDNDINEIQSLAKLESLKSLYLEHNHVKDIKPLAELIMLEALNLNSNQIQNISEINNLNKLRSLDLDSNKIQSLRPILQFLEENYKTTFSVKRNPLTDPPIEIADRGVSAIINYFKELEQGVREDIDIAQSLVPVRYQTKFDVVKAVNTRFSATRADDPMTAFTRSVDFVCSKGQITVYDDKDAEMFAAILTLSNDGKCRLVVDGKELTQWQFRRMALEKLFFSSSE